MQWQKTKQKQPKTKQNKNKKTNNDRYNTTRNIKDCGTSTPNEKWW
jgi:hypothetical protein